jgi:hypothetical protein
MLDDSMYPVDALRPLAHTLRSTAFSWHDADHRLVEKFAEDMTMQDFIDAAEKQRDRTLREHARMMAAFMNHDGAANQTTLGEILDRDQVIKGVSVAFMAALGVILAWGSASQLVCTPLRLPLLSIRRVGRRACPSERAKSGSTRLRLLRLHYRYELCRL